MVYLYSLGVSYSSGEFSAYLEDREGAATWLAIGGSLEGGLEPGPSNGRLG